MDSHDGSIYDSRITFSNFLHSIGRQKIINSIVEGLTATPKRIASMFFYDAVGSKLFEKITRLPEYYPSRIERKLIKKFAESSCKDLRDIDIIELGSGDCSKISILLDEINRRNLKTISYKPFDVSINALKESAGNLVNRYEELKVHCIAADFLTQLDLIPRAQRCLYCFFGGTIGNLSERQRESFLKSIGNRMQPQDMLLIGMDMAKSKEALERAYNDRDNVTASFNLNILNVVNSITGSDFDTEAFEHFAFFNEEFSRIEMHLRAVRKVNVNIPGYPSVISISEGESIHTEDSYKFTVAAIAGLFETAGLRIDKVETDPDGWFSLSRISKE